MERMASVGETEAGDRSSEWSWWLVDRIGHKDRAGES